MRRVLLLILLSLLPLSAGWAANALKYDTMRIAQEDGVVRLVLDMKGPVTMKYFSLPKPDRFVVDLKDIVRAGNRSAVDFSNTPISGVRVGIRDGDDLRLVLELSEAAKGKAYVLEPADGHGHRLVVELENKMVAKRPESVVAQVAKREEPVKRSEPPASVPVAPAVAAAPAPAPVVVAPVEKVETVVTAPAPAPAPAKSAPPAPVKRDAIEVEPLRDIVVAIDAGHGGVDVGAIGAKGTYEKDVVLQIARQLEARVRREPGMVPLMIRDGDHFVSLRDRINKARTYKADMFISIHADAFPDPRAKGASVYALSQRGATNEAARMLANRENAADLIGGVSLDDKDELLASVLLDLSQNATIEASLDVAGRVLQGLKRTGRVHKQHVEQAGFVVLKSPDIPSILVETAFISNPGEEANLLSASYQEKLADAMMKGVRSYFATNPPPGTRIAAREHVIKRGETLSGIANHYNVSTRIIRATNRLKDDTVHIGQVLQIPLSDS